MPKIELTRRQLKFRLPSHLLPPGVASKRTGPSNPAGTAGTTNRSTQSAHVNLIWSPVANTDVGVEYIVANRTTEDGASGHLSRLQASAKYTF